MVGTSKTGSGFTITSKLEIPFAHCVSSLKIRTKIVSLFGVLFEYGELKGLSPFLASAKDLWYVTVCVFGSWVPKIPAVWEFKSIDCEKPFLAEPSEFSSQISKSSTKLAIGIGFTTTLNEVWSVKQPVALLITLTKIGCESRVVFAKGDVWALSPVLASAAERW